MDNRIFFRREKEMKLPFDPSRPRDWPQRTLQSDPFVKANPHFFDHSHRDVRIAQALCDELDRN